jgi:hypothetical protein
LSWSPDGKALAIGLSINGYSLNGAFTQHRVLLWDAQQRHVARHLWTGVAPRVLRWNDRGDILVAAGGNSRDFNGLELVGAKVGAGEVRVWDVRRPFTLSGTTRAVLPVATPVIDVALQGATVFFAAWNERPRLWTFAE